MTEPVKKTEYNFPGAGPGRPKGAQNKTTALLKDAILKAAETAGGEGGMAGYLALQAIENPGPFMALLGKVLPMQLAGDADNPINLVHTIKREIVRANTGNPDS